jgi:coiled-coil domain-containing protein 40
MTAMTMTNTQTGDPLERVRLTLREQLLKTRDRVKLELLEQEEVLKTSKRAREDADIELNGMKRQLSRLQTNLKTMDQRYEEVSKKRVECQHDAAETKQLHAKKLKKDADLGKEESTRQNELDSILLKIRQAKEYNDEMKSEVAVTRTMAKKKKEDLKAQAKSKLSQDTYIDGLNAQVTRLEDDIVLTEAQLSAQKEQSADANKMIRETNTALEQLASEQRRLVQQWNSSVNALGRRDQALAAATKELKKVQDSIRELEGENMRLQRDIQTQQESNEATKVSINRLEEEIVSTEQKKQSVGTNVELLADNFKSLQEKLKNTKQQEKELQSAVTKLESEISTANQRCERLIRERHAIEEKISTTRYEQTSISKAARNLINEEKSLLAKIHDKELEIATIENDISRLDIEKLNTQSHNSQLLKRLEDELSDLKDAEARITMHEGEMRRYNKDIEKKTNRVAVLNREYSRKLESCEEDEPLGPLESTIKSLSSKIQLVNSEIHHLQQQWTTHQGELVQQISNTNSIQEKDEESSKRQSILQQKLLRLTQEIHSNESSLKSLETSMRGLHSDITRLNDLIEQNTRLKEDHTNRIAVLKMESERELAELEEQCNILDDQITKLTSSKKKMLDEVGTIEEQIQDLARKTQLEKDTQNELVSSKDVLDAKGMEREIQRMNHRLEGLLKTQERLLREMELAILKRGDKFYSKK